MGLMFSTYIHMFKDFLEKVGFNFKSTINNQPCISFGGGFYAFSIYPSLVRQSERLFHEIHVGTIFCF